MARTFIEKIGENDLYDDALAHFYESSKSKEKAIELYEKIIAVEVPRQHVFYKASLIRLNELKKDKPRLIYEIVFPTGKPRAQWFSQR